MNIRLLNWLLALALNLPINATANERINYEFGGHLKTRGSVQGFPTDSIFNELSGSSAEDLDAELRLMYRADRGPWDIKADGQAIFSYGESVEYSRDLAAQAPALEPLFGRLPNDARRWWDLTYTAEDSGKRALTGRLDRLSVGYTGPSAALRFGRQAITWGNGLIFTPMDIVNPFDPTQVDTEFKPGDDMFYAQYLRHSGDDIQAAYVVRRDPATGKVTSDQATLAVKYHGFAKSFEYDMLAANHFADAVLAVGGSRDVGGAVWRSDLVLSDTDDEGFVAQFVVNTSYSWVWAGRNVSGNVEYFFNGFGQHDGCYTPDCLAENPQLVKRIARGQLFNLGRHYLAGSLLIEMTPLFTLTPNLFWNLGDPSVLLQIVPSYSLGDNLVLLGALSIPMGANGTEYGGIETNEPDEFFSREFNLFVQLGWYF